MDYEFRQALISEFIFNRLILLANLSITTHMQSSAECYNLWIVLYHVQYHTELSQLFILILAFLSFNPAFSVLQRIGFIVKMEYRLDSHEGIEPEFTAVGALHRGLQAPLRFLMSVSLHL